MKSCVILAASLCCSVLLFKPVQFHGNGGDIEAMKYQKVLF